MNPKPTKFQPKQYQVEGYILSKGNLDAAAKWCGGEILYESDAELNEVLFLSVPTLIGNLKLELGDVLIRDTDGRICPWEIDEFKEIFESVEEVMLEKNLDLFIPYSSPNAHRVNAGITSSPDIPDHGLSDVMRRLTIVEDLLLEKKAEGARNV